MSKNIKISLNLFTFRQSLPNFVSPNWKLHNQYCGIIKNYMCMPIHSFTLICQFEMLRKSWKFVHALFFDISFFLTFDFLRGRGPNYKCGGDKSSLSFLRFSTVFLNVKVAKNDQKRPKMANSVSAVNSFIRACHLDQFIHLVLTSFFKLPIFPAEEGRAANEGIKVLRLSKT